MQNGSKRFPKDTKRVQREPKWNQKATNMYKQIDAQKNRLRSVEGQLKDSPKIFLFVEKVAPKIDFGSRFGAIFNQKKHPKPMPNSSFEKT